MYILRFAILALFTLLGVSSIAQFTSSGLPQAVIHPDTLVATLNQCNDSVIVPVTIKNTGNAPLLYNVGFGEGFVDYFESGTSRWTLEGEWGLSTNAFTGNYSLAVSPNGDYDDNWAYSASLTDEMQVFDAANATIGFDLYYDMYCCGGKSEYYGYCDNVYAQISVNGGAFQDLYSWNCSNWDWIYVSLDLSGYVTNGDRFVFRFLFSSDDYGNSSGIFIDNFEMEGAGPQSSWLSIENTNGLIQAGDSIQIPVVFSSVGQTSGVYSGTLPIETSDTSLAVKNIYYEFTLQGYPLMAVSPGNIDFGMIPENGVGKDTLIVQNTGCDTLHLTGIQLSNPRFMAEFSPVAVAPNEQFPVPVQFIPDSVIGFSGNLILFSDADTAEVSLTGSGIAAPRLEIYPPLYADTVANCGDSVLVSLMLHNTGPVDLNFVLEPQVNSIVTPACLPYNYDYHCCGFGIYQVEFGSINHASGSAADELNLDLSSQFVTRLEAGQPYPIRIQTGTQNYENVRAWIDYNSNGSFEYNEIVFESLDTYLSVHEGTITIPAMDVKLYTRLRMRVVSEYYSYGIPDACGVVYYGQFEDYSVVITGSSNLTLADTILPGDSLPFQFMAYTTGLNQGMQSFNLTIASNDPLASPLIYPVNIWLEGKPELHLGTTTIDFDSLFQQEMATQNIDILNTGCAPLYIPRLISPFAGLTANFSPAQNDTAVVMPGDSIRLVLTFQTDIPGPYDFSLPLLSNDTDSSISIHAFVLASSIPGLNPEYSEVNLNGCNDSIQYPISLYNQGLDTLHWYAAENAPGKAVSFLGIPTQDIRIDSIGSIPERGTLEFWFTQEYEHYWENMGLLSLSVNNFASIGAGFDFRYYYDYFELLAGDSNGNYQYFTITNYIPHGSWNHVAVSWDHDVDSIWIYFNGALVQSANVYYQTTKEAGLRIGKSGESTNLYMGKIDEVRFWETTRSRDQIAHFYDQSVSPSLPLLRAYYSMNEDSGAVLFDQTIHAHHAGLVDAARIISGIPLSNSPDFSPQEGIISPGDSAQIDITLHAAGLPSGVNQYSVSIESNSPAFPFLMHMADVSLQGAPEILVTPDHFAMDSLMAGLEIQDTLIIRNPGCDTLFITQFLNQKPDFRLETDSLIIEPFGVDTVFLIFNPGSTGLIEDTLHIISNAGNVYVSLEGTGLPAPNFVYSPDTLFLVSTACDVPVSGTVTFSNTGGVGAPYLVEADSGIFREDFESGLVKWETNSYAWMISSNGYQSSNALYFFQSYSSLLNHSIDLKSPLQVTNPENVFVSFDVSHYLSCSWYGYDLLNFYVSKNGGDWVTEYSLTCNNYNYSYQSFQLNDVEEGDILRFRIGISRYGYYSYVYGYIDNFTVTGVSKTPGFNSPAQSGTLEPDSSISLNISFMNTNLELGSHLSFLTVQTGNPLQPVIQVPVVVDFQGEPHSMSHTDTLDFGFEMATSSTQLPLLVMNTGCDTLDLISLQTQSLAFSGNFTPEQILPGDTFAIGIQFHPPIAGSYLDTLEIITSAESLQVILIGNGGLAPQLAYNPDSIILEAACSEIVNIQLDLQNTGDTTLNWVLDPAQYEGLLLYYPFRGDVNDHSGNNRHLTNYGTMPTRGLEDKDSTARLFTGIESLNYNNEAEVGDNLFVPYATVSLWVNAESAAYTNYQKLFFLNYGLDISISSGMINAYASASNSEYFSLEAPFSYGQWVHVAVTFDGVSYKLYLNGEPVDSQYADSCMLEYYPYSKRVELGNQSGYSSLFGTLDEVRFYNRGLPEAEISALYESTKQLYLITTASPVIGSLDPTETTTVTLSFNTEYLKTGSHTGMVYIRTNDPMHLFSGIPYRINITGVASPSLSAACHDFGSVLANAHKTDSVKIVNNGCSELIINALTTNSVFFEPESGPITVAPFNTKWVHITFSPATTGSYSDTLHLGTNAGILHHCLNGSSPGKPHITINNNLFTRILACTNTATDEILIQNSGNIPLTVSIVPDPADGWLEVPVTEHTVLPGDQSNVSLVFSRVGLSSGVYSTQLTLITNDPDYPLLTIHVHMLVSNTYLLADLGTDTAFCTGGSHLLNPGYFSTYTWSTGAVTPSINITTPGTYSVTVSDISGCISADTLLVEMVDAPLVFAGNDTLVCTGKTLQLNAQVLNPLALYPKTAVLGNGTDFTTTEDGNPLSTNSSNRRTQYFYDRYELNQAGLKRGMLNSIAFNLQNTDGIPLQDYSIRIGFIDSYSTNYMYYQDSLTPVFYAASITPVNGWNVMQFDTSLYWDGIQHMIVALCHNNTDYGSSPEYQYSYMYRSVYSYYCSFCGDLCNISYGYTNSVRPNIRVQMDADINEYTWSGPAGFQSTEPSPVIENVYNYHEGTYELVIDNGFGCVGSDAIYVSVNPSPDVNVGNNLSIVGWDSTYLHATVTIAPGPYTYQWTPVTGIDNPDSSDVVIFINQTETYTIEVTSSNGCTGKDYIVLNVTPRFPVSGQLTYNNAFQTPLPQSTILRKNSESILTDTTSTDETGHFVFPLLPVYYNTLTGTSTLPVGGINATDALLVARHITGSQTMNGLKLRAADVNATSFLSAADALLILHRTAGNISTFPAGNWVVENRLFYHQGPASVINLLALSVGDVNGSYNPGLKAEPSVWLKSDDFVVASERSRIPVPVRVTSDMNLGALTLSLAYNPADLRIDEITSPLDGLVSNIDHGVVRLAWCDAGGYSLKTGDTFIILWITPTNLSQNEESYFTLVDDAELADADARIRYNEVLRIPRIRTETEKSEDIYLGQNQPNPFSGLTEIPFILPEAGRVKIEVLSILGETVQSAPEAVFDTGAHYWPLEITNLKPGMYLYRFTFSGETRDYRQTRTMILTR